MTRQMKAEREKRAAILESEGMRHPKSFAPRARKQAKILQAEGMKEAAFREAEARERAAQAEANATTSVSDAIAGGSAQAINYFIAQKYVEAIGKFATSPNAKTILFPVEATQLMGTLGGIGELAGRCLASGAPKAAPPRPKTEATADAALRRAFPACRGSKADARQSSSPAGCGRSAASCC